jgi:hypothetical protein
MYIYMREIGDCFSNEGSCDYSAGGSDNVEDFQNIGRGMRRAAEAAGARPSTGGFVKTVEKAPGIAAAAGPSTGGFVKTVEKAPGIAVEAGVPFASRIPGFSSRKPAEAARKGVPFAPGNLGQLGSSLRRAVNKVEKAPGRAAVGPSTGGVMDRVEKTPLQNSFSAPSFSDLPDIPQFSAPSLPKLPPLPPSPKLPPLPREDTTLSPTTTIASASSSIFEREDRQAAAPAARRKQPNLVKSQSQFIPKTGNVLTARGVPPGKFMSFIKEGSNTTTTPSWDPYTSVDTTFAPATTAASWDPYTSVDTTFAPTTPEPKETNFVPRIDKDPITLGGAPSAGDYSDNNQPEEAIL